MYFKCLSLCVALVLLSACATPTRPLSVSPTPAVTPMPTAAEIRPADGAGRWYPDDPEELAKMVDAYLEQAGEPVRPGEKPAIIIVPHAGYIYAGAVAAHAFRQIQGQHYDTVVVIGDTHSGNGSAKVAVYAQGAFQTPLGVIPVDEATAQAVINAAPDLVSFDRAAFQAEHPVENQLPFLQRTLTDFRIVPIVVREGTLANAQVLSQALVQALAGKNALIVASTDLSHYPAYDDALRVDAATLAAIEDMDPQALLDVAEKQMGEGVSNLVTCFCSPGAVLTAMLTAQAWDAQPAVLYYANSGDTPFGDHTQVVGYGAVAFWPGKSGSPGFALPTVPSPPSQSIFLDLDEQRELLALARRTIATYLDSGTVPVYKPETPELMQQRGAFVTLEKNGELRGCIGNLVAERPLYLTVQYAALAAALSDPRFPPVTAGELPEITLEISVLSDLEPVADPATIEVGRDGLLIVLGQQQGVLLPQVPVEQGWDRQEFLRQVCRKAGLPDSAWQDPQAQLYRFTAQVFWEE